MPMTSTISRISTLDDMVYCITSTGIYKTLTKTKIITNSNLIQLINMDHKYIEAVDTIKIK